MVTNSFEIKSFMHPMRRLSMHSWWAMFFPSMGSYSLFLFLVSQCLFNMFSLCSHEVLQVPKFFLKAFQIAPQFHPMWFHQRSTLIYVNSQIRLQGEYSFVIAIQKRWFHWGRGQCSGCANNRSPPWTLKRLPGSHSSINKKCLL
jgi:hypothetical protein